MKKTPFTLAAAVCALFILALSSCGPKTLLDETRTFQNDTWMRFTPEHYDIEAPNSEDCYNFTVSVTVDTSRYHQPSIPIMLEMESPNTEKRTLFSTLILHESFTPRMFAGCLLIFAAVILAENGAKLFIKNDKHKNNNVRE